VLVVIGALLLLDNFGWLPFSIWSLFWPLLLIAAGAWVLLGVYVGRRGVEMQHLAIPLDGAPAARIKISHGAGELSVRSGAGAGELLAGDFGGGVEHRTEREGGRLKVKLSSPLLTYMPWEWFGRNARSWSFSLSAEVPLSLEVEAGASSNKLDLSGVRLSGLDLQVGASATELSLPAGEGTTRVKIEAGAASVDIRIPPEAEARIRWEGGLSSLTVDGSRFNRSGSTYETNGFAAAADKLDIDIEAGVGSVTIR
jgi:hypothetical protein